jgi:serine/threonine protein kinase
VYLIGRTLSHYRINAAVGAGGMGEVYRATDMKLGREVALKVLPPNVASDSDRLARFQREAHTIAALNHPNIVTLFSVEESEGIHFLTMELVTGQRLDRLIAADGLPLDQIREITTALVEALAAAHEKGIIHRDLKPANVMVTPEGRVKVLDFGLAKELRAKELPQGAPDDVTLQVTERTQVGTILGTPAYMSPEQITAQPLDHRTDIFSLGVILHEMSTGRRPFEGKSSVELASAILRDHPPPVTDLRADLPADLARTVHRCLEKDPRHRFQTARDVGNELRELRDESLPPSRAAAVPSRPVSASDSGFASAGEGFWVAVLPFKYKGSDPTLDALAEGLVEQIIMGFSRFSYMRVIAHSSTARDATDSGDIRVISKQLGARYVLEGNLRQLGPRVRIAIQLVDATTGAHIWAETYDRSYQPDAAFDLQDELVPKIVSTIADAQGVLPHNMSESLRSRRPDELTPYEAVLRSFAYIQRISLVDYLQSREALLLAVERSPDYAPAWAWLALIYREDYSAGFNLTPDPLERGYAAARHAIEIAPSDNIGFHALASIQFFRRDLLAFRTSAERAIAINPMDSFTLCYMGGMLAQSGEWERGCAITQRARSLNPHHPGWYWFADAFNAFRHGDYRQAQALFEKVNMPNYWHLILAQASTCGHLGELESARNLLRTLQATKPNFEQVALEESLKWYQPTLVDQILDGLRKAGVEFPWKLAGGPG